MFLEILTEMEDDAQITKDFYKDNVKDIPKSLAKNIARCLLNGNQIAKVKKILKVIKEQ